MDLVRLEKIWRLTSSSVPGEAAAALDRARVLIEREGLKLTDIPHLLRNVAAKDGSSSKSGSRSPENGPDQDWRTGADESYWAAYAEKVRTSHGERRRRDAPERAEVLARYGSFDAVLVWTSYERLLRTAVSEWSEFEDWPRQAWTRTIDGRDRLNLTKVSHRVIEAVEGAYPLPTTITQAAAEYDMWERRDHDLSVALFDTGDTKLDLPADLRRHIVLRLLETELQAVSIGEVLLRQRHSVASDFVQPDIEKAVLRDLDRLVQRAERHDAPAREPSELRSGRPRRSKACPAQGDLFPAV